MIGCCYVTSEGYEDEGMENSAETQWMGYPKDKAKDDTPKKPKCMTASYCNSMTATCNREIGQNGWAVVNIPMGPTIRLPPIV